MRAWGIGALIVAFVACARGAGNGGAVPPDGTGDQRHQGDGGTPDGGDPSDAGPSDAGPSDAGPSDAGPSDAGPKFGGPGPWPIENVTYAAADGINENPVVGVSTDETQNLWIATHQALYLLKPGEKTFKRFDASSGLHLPGNPVFYCDKYWAPGGECPIAGEAGPPGISEIVGGGADEVFVGYYGKDDPSVPGDIGGTWSDPNRHSGMLDRVRLKPDGTLDVVRFDMVSGVSVQFWHNRTVWRMVYDHFIHKHELYVGTNHGVNKFSPDKWHPTIPGTWFNSDENNRSWMSDHLHPQACYHHWCTNETDLRLGDWRGMALTPQGDLWVAGRWAAGLINYVPENERWYARGGEQAFKYNFGDYYTYCNGNRPIFCVPQEGDSVNLSAVTTTPDGLAWFASGPIYGAKDDVNYGVASWKPWEFTYYDPIRDIGLAESNVRDMIALPDGRLVVAAPNTGIVIWDPKTGKRSVLRGGQGIPDDFVQRIAVDTMVDPPALHIATWSGATVLRKLP